MAKLSKTMRFDCTRVMTLAQDGPTTETSMPCHLTVHVSCRGNVNAEKFTIWSAYCDSVATKLRQMWRAAELTPKSDAATVANAAAIVCQRLIPDVFVFDKVSAMFGVIERAEASADKKAKIEYAWEILKPSPNSPIICRK